MVAFPTVIPDAIVKTDEQQQLSSYFAQQPPLGQDIGQGILRDYFAQQPPLADTVKDVLQPAPQAEATPPTPTVPQDAISQGIANADQGLVGMARSAASKAGIDPNLFARQIYQESGFDPQARNPSGASGIAQLMPQYYQGVNAFDPQAALTAAASTMANHLQQYGGDWSQALAAYNAGAGNLARYGLSGLLDDSFAGGQTKRYVANILGTGGALSPASAQSPVPSSSGAPTIERASPSAPSSQNASQSVVAASTGPLPSAGVSQGPLQSLQAYMSDLGQKFSDTASSLLSFTPQQDTTTPAPSDNTTAVPSNSLTPSQSYNDMVGAQPQPSGGLAGLDLATSPQGPQATDTSALPLGQVPTNIGNVGMNVANALTAPAPPSTEPPPSPWGMMAGVGNQVIGAGQNLWNQGLAEQARLSNPNLPPEERAQAQRDAMLNFLSASVGVPEGEMANVAERAAAPLAEDATRMFHGTGSAFAAPDAAKFDPNGLFGPGYYLTSDPRVASSYAGSHPSTQIVSPQEAQVAEDYLRANLPPGTVERLRIPPSYDAAGQNLMAAQMNLAGQLRKVGVPAGEAMPLAMRSLPSQVAGPNVRAVNVPAGLRLLDADASAPTGLVATLQKQIDAYGGSMGDSFDEALPTGKLTGADVYQALNRATSEGDKEWASIQLQRAGYDGIRYNGGQRVPLMDEAGQPIQHTAVVIFPESLPKITNALSGTPMGSFPAIGGAIAGGYAGYQSDPNAPFPERLQKATEYGLGGALGMHVLSGGKLPFGMSIEDVTQPGAAAGEEAARAGNILLSKLPEGVQDIVKETAANAPAAFQTAVRGVIPDVQVAQLADQVGSSANQIVQKWQPGQAGNAETLLALRNAMAAKSQQVVDLGKTVAAGTASPVDLLQFQQAIRDQMVLQQTVSGTTAEAGRALRQFRQSVSGVIQSGDAQRMQDLLNKMGGAQWTQDLAQKLTHLDTTDPVQTYQFMRDALQPQFKDYLTELWYNSLLSGPKTHLVKSMSETLSLLMSPVERVAAAAVDVPLSALQGRPRARFAGEAVPDVFGMVQGIPEAVQAGLFAFNHGFRLSDTLGSDYMRTQAFRGPLGAVINAPSHALGAAAEMMGSIAEAGALNAFAYRTARTEGLAGDALVQRIADLRANPTPAMLQYASDTGRYRVYQAPPGKTTEALLSLRDSLPVGLGRILLPFLQTPVNLAKFGLTRSPLGVLNPTLYANIAKGSPAAADQIGRILMGSMVAAGVALEFAKGNITGAAPTNPAERDAWTRQGKTPFSVRVGNNWYSYQRAEPLNQTFSQVAAAVDAANSGKDALGAAQQAVATIGSNMISQTYMQSLSRALEAMKDPTRAAGTFLEGLASSPIPAAVRDVAQIQDPTYRQVTNPLEAIQSVIPGQSQNLPPVLTAFGQPRPRETSNISPIAVSPSHVDPVDAELAKYRVEPGLTGKTLRGIDLTRQEAAEHQTVSGQLVHAVLSQLISDPRYAQLSDMDKARALQLAITHAKDQGAQQYLGQLVQQQGKDAILQRIQQKAAQRYAPVTP